MSIPVELRDLAAALDRVGSGYLLSTPLSGQAAGRPKVVTVDPFPDGGLLRVPAPGRGTLRNVADNSHVSLAFWPAERHGLSLLVDGTAEADGEDVVVTPASAVWHRPRAHASGAGDAALAADDEGCRHDCAPVRTGPADHRA